MPPLIPPAKRLADFARMLSSASDAELNEVAATRRGLLFSPPCQPRS
jgi:hypothetical protein